jgi:hypothetical protein
MNKNESKKEEDAKQFQGSLQLLSEIIWWNWVWIAFVIPLFICYV